MASANPSTVVGVLFIVVLWFLVRWLIRNLSSRQGSLGIGDFQEIASPVNKKVLFNSAKNTQVEIKPKAEPPTMLKELGEELVEAGTQNVSSIPANLLSGRDVPVVGESHYIESFKNLEKILNNNNLAPELQFATLRLDPENKFSKSGKAVSVQVAGFQVGHISEKLSPIVYDSLSALGGFGRVNCQVSVDHYGRNRFNSVTLFMALPLTREADTCNEKLTSLVPGNHIVELGELLPVDFNQSVLKKIVDKEGLFIESNLHLLSEGQICGADDAPIGKLIDGAPKELVSKGLQDLYYVSTLIVANDGKFYAKVICDASLATKKVRTGNSLGKSGGVITTRFVPAFEADFMSWLRFRTHTGPISDSTVPAVVHKDLKSLYFWSEMSNIDGRIYSSVLSQYIYPYAKDWERIRKWINGVGSVWLLCRRTIDESQRYVFDVCLPDSQDVGLLPFRPIVPEATKKIESKKLRLVSPSNRPDYKVADLEIKSVAKAQFANDVSVAEVEKGFIQFTYLDVIEEMYLTKAIEEIGLNPNLGKGLKTSLLVGGSFFDINQSAKAREAAKRGIPIVSVKTFREHFSAKLADSETYKALIRHEEWLQANQSLPPYRHEEMLSQFVTKGVDVFLLPGAALDTRPLTSELSFFGELVGLRESQEEIRNLFELLGGIRMDSAVIRVPAKYVQVNGKTRLEFRKSGVLFGRTPANESRSLAESAKLYGISESWVRIDWLPNDSFQANFAFWSTLN